MHYSIHILDTTAAKVKGAVYEIAAVRGQSVVTPESMASVPGLSIIGVFSLAPRWITVCEPSKHPRKLASELASQLQAFVVAITLSEPDSWGFQVFDRNQEVAQYYYELPDLMVEKHAEKLGKLENLELERLGVKGLSVLRNSIGKRQKRLTQSDSRLEMHYRSRISRGELNLPVPDLHPELPGIIHNATGLSTKARIRKILGTAHMHLIGAVAEFSLALGLPNWLDECVIDQALLNRRKPNCFALGLIEKTKKI